ncbi:hypothetical protein V6N11_011814 [Hibiscus sabdariffa]|uniref:Uncharacterized protein n=1 Tax=Hibiscus sabdariffa TaxID=183260 RepID=A0ABR2SA11_9ROSI
MFEFLLVILFSSWKITTSALPVEEFLHCLSFRLGNSSSVANLVYTQHNSSYSSVLKSSAQNFRFTTPSTPKPLAVLTPLHTSHIQAMEAYKVPFVVIDLVNLRSVQVNVEKATAWVESGATIGELYYEILLKSRTLTFPAGIGHTVVLVDI